MNLVEEFKKGWMTSEFWVVAVTTIAPTVAWISGYEFDVDGAVTAIGAIGGGLGWAANRTWLKRKRLEAVVEVQKAEVRASQPVLLTTSSVAATPGTVVTPVVTVDDDDDIPPDFLIEEEAPITPDQGDAGSNIGPDGQPLISDRPPAMPTIPEEGMP